MNLSETGMQVEVPYQVVKGTYVTFTSSNPRLHGTGSVRSCIRRGAQYAVGVEFSGGLKWKPASE